VEELCISFNEKTEKNPGWFKKLGCYKNELEKKIKDICEKLKELGHLKSPRVNTQPAAKINDCKHARWYVLDSLKKLYTIMWKESPCVLDSWRNISYWLCLGKMILTLFMFYIPFCMLGTIMAILAILAFKILPFVYNPLL